VALPILIGLLTGLLFFARSMEREPVARLSCTVKLLLFNCQ
jgi:hypothetical protein